MNMILPLWSCLPFIILLISISVFPSFLPKLWHRVENFIFVILSFSALACVYHFSTFSTTAEKFVHVLEYEYVPFVVIIYTLYTIGTGLKITLSGNPTPFKNALFLFCGGILSNFIGTTGASVLLIYPFLKWNAKKNHKTHLVMFFIFIVSNIGGSLTPLGDAPLFIGYLQGIPFSWSFFNLLKISLFIQVLLLSIFMMIDFYKNKNDDKGVVFEKFSIQIIGKTQLILIPIVLLILVYIDNEKTFTFLKEFLLLCVCLISYGIDKKCYHLLSKKAHWSPVLEVARVFLAIFITLMPISIILKAGTEGPFSFILNQANVNGVPDPKLYFWFSGIFSAFLDNAPTYLLFYKMIGPFTAEAIMNQFNNTLIAISCSTIFFGALTYIGNAPNFMIKNIAKQHTIAMPSFLVYFLWASAILVPVFYIVQYLFIPLM
ncbi:MAG: hypothetical protein HEEMFOPI_00552 [Holosporales bacterium]